MPMMLKPLGDGESITIDKAVTFFGRHPDCDVVLTHSRKVSRKHCCIAQINDYFVVRDLGSMNGVRINDDPVSKEARLSPGDEVWIGDVGFRFEPGDPKKRGANGNTARSGDRNGVRRVSPDLLSRNVPVAIPEEGQDLVIEETNPKLREASKTEKKKEAQARRKKLSEEVIELSDQDILD